MKLIDLTGHQYGRLTVIRRAGHRGKKVIWLCSCKCGGEARPTSANLRNGTTKSCGCLQIETAAAAARKRSTVHGHNPTGKASPTYNSWHSMRARCTRASHKSYPNYGGRGITVCDRWREFANFLSDMGERPDGMTLDRIDNDGNYEPLNCRWATASQQQQNKRCSS